jgi:hypothetical protein
LVVSYSTCAVVDRDAARAFSSGAVVDLVVRHRPSPHRTSAQRVGDGRGQRRLAVVDVTDRADVARGAWFA